MAIITAISNAFLSAKQKNPIAADIILFKRFSFLYW